MTFYDLSIPYPGQAPQRAQLEALRKTAELAVQLGYTTIALDYVCAGKAIPNLNPIKKLGLPNARELTRVTLESGDFHQQNRLTAKTASSVFDIVAVRPMSDNALRAACATLEVDIISLDLSTRLPYQLKHSTLGQAVERGVHFEIAYGAAIRDATARRFLIGNAATLIRTTRGKNIILSSQAQKAMEIRAPYDVMNLVSMFGMSPEVGKSALTTYCRAVLVHAETRNTVQKGAVGVSLADTLAPNEKWKAGSGREDGNLRGKPKVTA